MAVVLLAGIAGGVWYLQAQKPTSTIATKAALLSAQDKSFSGDHDGAITLLKAQLKTTQTTAEKVSTYVAIGTNYENKGDNAAALAAYKSAQSQMETFGTDNSVARLAEKTGDKATALDYYQRCLKLVTTGKAQGHGGDVPTLKAAITRLGGTS